MRIILQKDGSCYTSTKKRLYYTTFAELKNEVIKALDGIGWSNKKDVDLRSITSCINYLYAGNQYHIEEVRKECNIVKR